MELLLQRNREHLKEKKVYFSQKNKIEEAVLSLNTKKILILTGIKYAGKTKFLVDLLRKTGQEDTTFYFNADIDFLWEVQKGEDLEMLLKLSEKIYRGCKIIALQNCSKIPGIKKLIQKLYREKKYKIILIGNSISIEGVHHIEILPLSLSSLPQEKMENFIEFWSFEEINLVRDISFKRFLRETLRNNIIFQDTVQTYTIKNAENIEKMLAYLAENNSYMSQREIQRELSLRWIDISLLTFMDYLSACINSKILQKMSLYDMKKGKEITTRQKYYFTDTAMRYSFLKESSKYKKTLLENLVFTELLKKWYTIQGLQNGRFELNFEAKKWDINYQIQLFFEEERNELKKEARKIEKLWTLSQKVILVEQLTVFHMRNSQLGEVQVQEIEDFLKNLK